MAESWQSAWVEVLPDFSNFKRAADTQMTSMLSGAGTAGGIAAGRAMGSGVLDGVKGLAAPLLAAFAALGIGRLVGKAIGEGIVYSLDAVDLASDLEQSTGAVLAVFKDQAATIEGFGKAAAKDVGLARTEYQKFAVVVGAQLKNLGIPVERISGQTNDLIELGADLAAQFGGPTSDAVNALSSLLRGERDPIERYGVGIKQADINARLAAQGLKDLTGDAKKQAEIQATLAILWEQTADAQGTFAAEGDTLAGQQQRLQATLQDTQTKLGESLLPVFSDLAGFANETLAPALDQMIDKVGPKLGKALKDSAPLIKDMAEDLAPLVEDLIIAGVEGIPGFISGLKDIAEELPDAIKFMSDLAKAGDGVANFLNDISDPDKNGSNAVHEFLFGQGSKDRTQWAEETFGISSPMAAKIKADMAATGKGAGQSLTEGIEYSKDTVESGFLGVTSPMAQKVRAQLEADMQVAGQNAALGLAAGIESKAAVAALRAREMGRAAAQALREEMKMRSPSKVMEQLGAFVGEGFAIGIDKQKSNVTSSMKSLVGLSNIQTSVGGSIASSGAGAVYVQNPFTGEYLLAQVDGRAQSVVSGQVNRLYAARR